MSISGAARAQAQPPEHDAQAYANLLRQVVTYLNGFDTLQADFTQATAGDADTSSGQVFIKKPRRLLWQYMQPHQQKLVANGKQFFFYDPQTEQVTQLPMSNTYTRIFLRDNLSFDGLAQLVTGYARTQNGFALELHDDSETVQRIVLAFERAEEGEGIRLKQIATTDTMGVETTVVLSNVKANIELADSRFDFTPPRYADPFAPGQ